MEINFDALNKQSILSKSSWLKSRQDGREKKRQDEKIENFDPLTSLHGVIHISSREPSPDPPPTKIVSFPNYKHSNLDNLKPTIFISKKTKLSNSNYSNNFINSTSIPINSLKHQILSEYTLTITQLSEYRNECLEMLRSIPDTDALISSVKSGYTKAESKESIIWHKNKSQKRQMMEKIGRFSFSDTSSISVSSLRKTLSSQKADASNSEEVTTKKSFDYTIEARTNTENTPSPKLSRLVIAGSSTRPRIEKQLILGTRGTDEPTFIQDNGPVHRFTSSSETVRAFHRACQYGQLSTVLNMLRRASKASISGSVSSCLELGKTDKDQLGNTVLHCAAMHDQPHIIKALIKHSLKPQMYLHQTNDLGQRAIQVTASKRIIQLLEILENRWPIETKVNNVTELEQNSIHKPGALNDAAILDQYELIRTLVRKAGSIDSIIFINKPYGKEQNTPLHDAAMWSACNAIDVLLDLGANPSSLNASGFTAFQLADKQTRRHFRQWSRKNQHRYADQFDEALFFEMSDQENVNEKSYRKQTLRKHDDNDNSIFKKKVFSRYKKVKKVKTKINNLGEKEKDKSISLQNNHNSKRLPPKMKMKMLLLKQHASSIKVDGPSKSVIDKQSITSPLQVPNNINLHTADFSPKFQLNSQGEKLANNG